MESHSSPFLLSLYQAEMLVPFLFEAKERVTFFCSWRRYGREEICEIEVYHLTAQSERHGGATVRNCRDHKVRYMTRNTTHPSLLSDYERGNILSHAGSQNTAAISIIAMVKVGSGFSLLPFLLLFLSLHLTFLLLLTTFTFRLFNFLEFAFHRHNVCIMIRIKDRYSRNVNNFLHSYHFVR